MKYAALVVLDHLKGADALHEIAFTTADTETEAIAAIRSMEWPREYWVDGKSICRIKVLVPLDTAHTFFTRRFAGKPASPVVPTISPRRRLRQKNAAEPTRRRRRKKT